MSEIHSSITHSQVHNYTHTNHITVVDQLILSVNSAQIKFIDAGQNGRRKLRGMK